MGVRKRETVSGAAKERGGVVPSVVAGGPGGSLAESGSPLLAGDVERLRAAVWPHLESVKAMCRRVGCVDPQAGSAPRAEAGEDPFSTAMCAVVDACDRGLEFLDNGWGTSGGSTSGGSTSGGAGGCDFRDYVHDLKTTVSPIKYKLDLLQRRGLVPLSFESEFGEIREGFEELLGAIEAGRRPLAECGGTSPPVARPLLRAGVAADEGPLLSGSEAGHVLVVDDDSDSRENLVDLLKELKLDVSLAEDGRQALELLEKSAYAPGGKPIDLVLLDLKMRNVDGLTVLAEMKKDFGLRSIPVVMVSAHSDVETQVRCIACGADDYLVKPPHPALLEAQVRSCLAKGRLRKQERLLGDQVRASKQRADDLLYNIFPYTVARDLVTTGCFEPRCCDNVAVLFCDVVGFTAYCDSRSPKEVVANLNDLFSAYEDAIEQCGVEKIKTIGDCIMVTAGLMRHFENPVLSCLECGTRMVAAAEGSGARWQVRIGIHVGPVVAGMAGRKHYSFDIWGDTVNTAARVQGTADPGAINLSEPAWSHVYKTCHGQSLGMKQLKGKTSMEVFRFEGFRVR